MIVRDTENLPLPDTAVLSILPPEKVKVLVEPILTEPDTVPPVTRETSVAISRLPVIAVVIEAAALNVTVFEPAFNIPEVCVIENPVLKSTAPVVVNVFPA